MRENQTMIAEVLVGSELVAALAASFVRGPRSFRSGQALSKEGGYVLPIPKPEDGGGVYTIPPVVITPDAPVPAPAPTVNCKAKIDAYVASLPDMTRDVIREAIAIGNAMQIDALATEVEKSDPTLAACLRAQKKG